MHFIIIIEVCEALSTTTIVNIEIVRKSYISQGSMLTQTFLTT